jgi:phosphoglycerate dehydrogenase-like enzyme
MRRRYPAGGAVYRVASPVDHSATVPAMPDADLPLLFVDHPFPEVYTDLVDGRAVVVGSGTDTGLDVADAILAGAVRPWNAAAFALAPKAKVISRVGVGYDNVVVADATVAGIVVCNTPLAPMVSTAEHALALIFAVTKHLPHHVARARQGLKGEPVGRALELDGCTLGLIGIGRIASRVANAAQALGMRVIACDPAYDESPVAGVELVTIDELLTESDVVSLHAPALPSTRQIINAHSLARMKPGAYLVNCARGVLVDHDALLAAIDNGQLAGVGLDVTDPEPLPEGHPLLDRANVVVTPHIASATVAGRRRLYEHSIENALAVLDGRPASIVTA